MKTLLGMGQSNAMGWGAGGIFPASASVTVWNSTNNLMNLTSLGSAFICPDIHAAPFVGTNNNMFYHAARNLSVLLGEDVRLIIVAAGGLAISNWEKSSGPMYARMKAVLAAAGVTTVDAFLWHQGESDNAAPSGYTADFSALLANMTTDGYINFDTPVVVGELSAQFTSLNPILNAMAGGRISVAPIHTFPTVDQTHFTGPALVQAGWQYAKKLREAFVGPFQESDMNFVSASAYLSASFPNNTNVKIPVIPLHGDKSWVDSSTGAFVAPVNGVYRFNAQGYIQGGNRTRLMLLDATGAELADAIAYDVSTLAAVVSGFADLDLPAGTSVFLGGRQSVGSTVCPTAQSMATYNKMSVTLLSEHS